MGIGAPGPIDFDTGYIIETANLKFKNFPLGPRVAEVFGRPTIVDADVTAFDPAELLKSRPQCRDECLQCRVARGSVHQHADPAHPLALLGAQGLRPYCRTGKEREEIAPH